MKKTKELIPFPIIKAASDGDAVAIEYILNHYQRYIAKLSTKMLTDEYSNGYYFVDKYIQEQITTALLKMILSFKI
ncbi:transcriptional regulator [Clostridium sp. DMHC 10]|uniref:helix-turn-helix domain-containing protein n=1 Tax=Clostridium sp. DMHC 10 TaxID=747377 RepID=UPI00069CC047|nr:helix-turn-helix domain-containing protein [Clostridium sp. DMHC 10]KOF57403.1 transcriptional regulator [Clostridium sp. DMHC 10]